MGETDLQRLTRIRKLMDDIYDAYIITMDDKHNSEYVHKRDQLIAYISNFTGSFGTVIITKTEALLWTDGRYHEQAQIQLSKEWILMKERDSTVPSPTEWLVTNCEKGQTVATDPYLISFSNWSRIQLKLNEVGIKFIAAETNLVYEIWDGRPPDIRNEIHNHPLQFTGKSVKYKVEKCREEMKKARISLLLITALDEVAYLLNLRGSDILYTPIFYGYIILEMNTVHFFVKNECLNAEAVNQLTSEEVQITYHPYNDVLPVLKQLITEHQHIWISNNSSAIFHIECSQLKINTGVTPVCLMKVIKNDTEVECMKKAHIKDGLALVKYFAWLECSLNNGLGITEISGAAKLEEFRREQENFVFPSFPTISSVGKHGAIIHYIPSPETDMPITDKELYLCDSGGQYYEGTTDVTRTLHFGTPTNYEKECFTRVFKGQAKLATAIFPPLIVGNYLDTLARTNLWKIGLNYLHGTGHGVGSYLCVHEYPVMISWKQYPEDPGMQKGIFISNEPGYYESGNFGIRLENIEHVVEAHTKYSYEHQQFLTFETVTLVPIQTKMLEISLLTDAEIEYLNAYHHKCLITLSPLLQKPEDNYALKWLEKETQPILKT